MPPYGARKHMFLGAEARILNSMLYQGDNSCNIFFHNRKCSPREARIQFRRLGGSEYAPLLVFLRICTTTDSTDRPSRPPFNSTRGIVVFRPSRSFVGQLLPSKHMFPFTLFWRAADTCGESDLASELPVGLRGSGEGNGERPTDTMLSLPVELGGRSG